MKHIYSNAIGTFVFDEKFNVIDKSLFKDVSRLSELEKLELISEEKKFLEKYSGADVIGFKEQIKAISDENTLNKLNPFFDKNKKAIRELVISQTKKSIRESVTDDLLIIQTIGSIDETTKIINMMYRRLNDWYSYHNPEFSAEDIEINRFCELILSKDKKNLLRELKVSDTMGKDLSKRDLSSIFLLAKEILELFKLIEKEEKYLTEMMSKICPNLLDLAGHVIGARLMKHAGSLKNLADVPSSTVQLYGAEKALFRHMRSGSKCPKHGLIIAHDFVAGAINKGKAARQLADKISLAVKVDVFGGKKDYGKFLLKKLIKNKGK